MNDIEAMVSPCFIKLAKHTEIGYNEVVIQTGDGMYGTEN